MRRLLLFLAAAIVGLDLYGGAVAPLGLWPALEVALAIAIGAGCCIALSHAPFFSPRSDV